MLSIAHPTTWYDMSLHLLAMLLMTFKGKAVYFVRTQYESQNATDHFLFHFGIVCGSSAKMRTKELKELHHDENSNGKRFYTSDPL